MRRLLVVLAAALVAAFVGLPLLLPAPRADFRPAFGRWWHAGDAALTPELTRIVDYWFRYHLVKGVTAALLLGVLIALGARVSARFRPPIAALGLVALAAVMANVQGAAAPFASLFPLLTTGDLRGPADALEARHFSPALDEMLDGYTRYHAVMVVLAAAVAVVFAVTSVALVLRLRRSPGHRRLLATGAAAAIVLTLAAAVLATANLTTTLDPEPGLLGFLRGGW